MDSSESAEDIDMHCTRQHSLTPPFHCLEGATPEPDVCGAGEEGLMCLNWQLIGWIHARQGRPVLLPNSRTMHPESVCKSRSRWLVSLCGSSRLSILPLRSIWTLYFLTRFMGSIVNCPYMNEFALMPAFHQCQCVELVIFLIRWGLTITQTAQTWNYRPRFPLQKCHLDRREKLSLTKKHKVWLENKEQFDD